MWTVQSRRLNKSANDTVKKPSEERRCNGRIVVLVAFQVWEEEKAAVVGAEDDTMPEEEELTEPLNAHSSEPSLSRVRKQQNTVLRLRYVYWGASSLNPQGTSF